MTIKANLLTDLVDQDDPVPVVWEGLWDIWSPPANDVSEHYEREGDSVNYEWTLHQTYHEFYTEVLPDRCVNDVSFTVPADGAVVVMDGMSVREASLFVEMLKDEGHEPDVGYGFATVPADTQPFRDRVNYGDLRKEYKTTHISSRDPSLDGDERIVWAPYPDTLAENIQAGKTEIGSVEEMYQKSEEALRNVLAELETNRVIVRSDHGYVRLESGVTFPSSSTHREQMQALFSGARHVPIDEGNPGSLVEDHIVTEYDGYYLPVGRFTWPARGKYTTYQHGGLSLLETMTPTIEISQ